MTYQPGIPTGSVPFNQDYLNLQQNFTQINTQFLVDHVPLTSTSGTPPNGYHKTVHLVPISTTASRPPNNQPINPADYTATLGYGQLLNAQINDGINIDTAFYFLTGGNRLLQMTRNFVPIASATGATFLPGGLIMQWGFVTVTGTLTITYPVAFSAPAFSIVTTQFNSGSSNIREWGQVFDSTSTTFTLRSIEGNGGTSGSPRTFYWTAIGQ